MPQQHFVPSLVASSSNSNAYPQHYTALGVPVHGPTATVSADVPLGATWAFADMLAHQLDEIGGHLITGTIPISVMLPTENTTTSSSASQQQGGGGGGGRSPQLSTSTPPSLGLAGTTAMQAHGGSTSSDCGGGDHRKDSTASNGLGGSFFASSSTNNNNNNNSGNKAFNAATVEGIKASLDCIHKAWEDLTSLSQRIRTCAAQHLEGPMATQKERQQHQQQQQRRSNSNAGGVTPPSAAISRKGTLTTSSKDEVPAGLSFDSQSTAFRLNNANNTNFINNPFGLHDLNSPSNTVVSSSSIADGGGAGAGGGSDILSSSNANLAAEWESLRNFYTDVMAIEAVLNSPDATPRPSRTMNGKGEEEEEAAIIVTSDIDLTSAVGVDVVALNTTVDGPPPVDGTLGPAAVAKALTGDAAGDGGGSPSASGAATREPSNNAPNSNTTGAARQNSIHNAAPPPQAGPIAKSLGSRMAKHRPLSSIAQLHANIVQYEVFRAATAVAMGVSADSATATVGGPNGAIGGGLGALLGNFVGGVGGYGANNAAVTNGLGMVVGSFIQQQHSFATLPMGVMNGNGTGSGVPTRTLASLLDRRGGHNNGERGGGGLTSAMSIHANGLQQAIHRSSGVSNGSGKQQAHGGGGANPPNQQPTQSQHSSAFNITLTRADDVFGNIPMLSVEGVSSGNTPAAEPLTAASGGAGGGEYSSANNNINNNANNNTNNTNNTAANHHNGPSSSTPFDASSTNGSLPKWDSQNGTTAAQQRHQSLGAGDRPLSSLPSGRTDTLAVAGGTLQSIPSNLMSVGSRLNVTTGGFSNVASAGNLLGASSHSGGGIHNPSASSASLLSGGWNSSNVNNNNGSSQLVAGGLAQLQQQQANPHHKKERINGLEREENTSVAEWLNENFTQESDKRRKAKAQFIPSGATAATASSAQGDGTPAMSAVTVGGGGNSGLDGPLGGGGAFEGGAAGGDGFDDADCLADHDGPPPTSFALTHGNPSSSGRSGGTFGGGSSALDKEALLRQLNVEGGEWVSDSDEVSDEESLRRRSSAVASGDSPCISIDRHGSGVAADGSLDGGVGGGGAAPAAPVNHYARKAIDDRDGLLSEASVRQLLLQFRIPYLEVDSPDFDIFREIELLEREQKRRADKQRERSNSNADLKNTVNLGVGGLDVMGASTNEASMRADGEGGSGVAAALAAPSANNANGKDGSVRPTKSRRTGTSSANPNSLAAKLQRKPENIFVFVCMNVMMRYVFVNNFSVNIKKLLHYLLMIQSLYREENPYHNALHAADVLQTTHIYLTSNGVHHNFSDLEIFCLLFSALVHDVGHLGVNNAYLIKTHHPIAVLYNDRSPLENMHTSIALHLFNLPEYNFLADGGKWSEDMDADFRHLVADIISGTDMKFHASIIANVNDILADGVIEDEEISMLMKAIVHAADLSNPMKPKHLYLNWMRRVNEEFWLQGDEEQSNGLPISVMCDRRTTKVPESQVGFINFIVKPFVQAFAILLPDVWVARLDENLGYMMDMSAKNKEKAAAAALQAAQKAAAAADAAALAASAEEESSTVPPPLSIPPAMPTASTSTNVAPLLSDPHEDTAGPSDAPPPPTPPPTRHADPPIPTPTAIGDFTVLAAAATDEGEGEAHGAHNDAITAAVPPPPPAPPIGQHATSSSSTNDKPMSRKESIRWQSPDGATIEMDAETGEVLNAREKPDTSRRMSRTASMASINSANNNNKGKGGGSGSAVGFVGRENTNSSSTANNSSNSANAAPNAAAGGGDYPLREKRRSVVIAAEDIPTAVAGGAAGNAKSDDAVLPTPSATAVVAAATSSTSTSPPLVTVVAEDAVGGDAEEEEEEQDLESLIFFNTERGGGARHSAKFVKFLCLPKPIDRWVDTFRPFSAFVSPDDLSVHHPTAAGAAGGSSTPPSVNYPINIMSGGVGGGGGISSNTTSAAAISATSPTASASNHPVFMDATAHLMGGGSSSPPYHHHQQQHQQQAVLMMQNGMKLPCVQSVLAQMTNIRIKVPSPQSAVAMMGMGLGVVGGATSPRGGAALTAGSPNAAAAAAGGSGLASLVAAGAGAAGSINASTAAVTGASGLASANGGGGGGSIALSGGVDANDASGDASALFINNLAGGSINATSALAALNTIANAKNAGNMNAAAVELIGLLGSVNTAVSFFGGDVRNRGGGGGGGGAASSNAAGSNSNGMLGSDDGDGDGAGLRGGSFSGMREPSVMTLGGTQVSSRRSSTVAGGGEDQPDAKNGGATDHEKVGGVETPRPILGVVTYAHSVETEVGDNNASVVANANASQGGATTRSRSNNSSAAASAVAVGNAAAADHHVLVTSPTMDGNVVYKPSSSADEGGDSAADVITITPAAASSSAVGATATPSSNALAGGASASAAGIPNGGGSFLSTMGLLGRHGSARSDVSEGEVSYLTRTATPVPYYPLLTGRPPLAMMGAATGGGAAVTPRYHSGFASSGLMMLPPPLPSSSDTMVAWYLEYLLPLMEAKGRHADDDGDVPRCGPQSMAEEDMRCPAACVVMPHSNNGHSNGAVASLSATSANSPRSNSSITSVHRPHSASAEEEDGASHQPSAPLAQLMGSQSQHDSDHPNSQHHGGGDDVAPPPPPPTDDGCGGAPSAPAIVVVEVPHHQAQLPLLPAAERSTNGPLSVGPPCSTSDGDTNFAMAVLKFWLPHITYPLLELLPENSAAAAAVARRRSSGLPALEGEGLSEGEKEADGSRVGRTDSLATAATEGVSSGDATPATAPIVSGPNAAEPPAAVAAAPPLAPEVYAIVTAYATRLDAVYSTTEVAAAAAVAAPSACSAHDAAGSGGGEVTAAAAAAAVAPSAEEQLAAAGSDFLAAIEPHAWSLLVALAEEVSALPSSSSSPSPSLPHHGTEGIVTGGSVDSVASTAVAAVAARSSPLPLAKHILGLSVGLWRCLGGPRKGAAAKKASSSRGDTTTALCSSAAGRGVGVGVNSAARTSTTSLGDSRQGNLAPMTLSASAVQPLVSGGGGGLRRGSGLTPMPMPSVLPPLHGAPSSAMTPPSASSTMAIIPALGGGAVGGGGSVGATSATLRSGGRLGAPDRSLLSSATTPSNCSAAVPSSRAAPKYIFLGRGALNSQLQPNTANSASNNNTFSGGGSAAFHQQNQTYPNPSATVGLPSAAGGAGLFDAMLGSGAFSGVGGASTPTTSTTAAGSPARVLRPLRYQHLWMPSGGEQTPAKEQQQQ